MRNQPEVTDKTRKALLDAFCELYRHKPIERITVQEITRLAGYNRSTFYQYFKDIYELLEYLQEEVMTRIQDFARDHVTVKSYADIETIAQVYESEGEYLSVLLGQNADSQFIKYLKQLMFPLIKETLKLPAESVEATYIQEFFITGVLSTFSRWYREKDISPNELASIISKIAIKGVHTQLTTLSTGHG